MYQNIRDGRGWLTINNNIIIVTDIIIKMYNNIKQ